MRNFWALPAILRVALASQPAFSVHDDVLAYPQFEVTFTEDYVTELQAQSRLLSDQGDEYISDSDPSDDPDTAGELTVKGSDGRDYSKAAKNDDIIYEYEEVLLDDQRYLCRLPIVDANSGRPDTNQTLSKQEQEKELARANDRGWELLQPMQGDCVYYWSGWWSYRYCYGQGVKQFHQLPPSQGIPTYPPVEDTGVTGFTLGSVEKSLPTAEKDLASSKSAGASKALGKLETRGESRYLVQRLGGGTLCDLTGKERRIEVQFHCNPASSDKISTIKEVATCAYLMVIQTPRLCNDVAFLPPQKDSPNRISCSPIISQAGIPEYEKEMEELTKERDLGEQIPNPFEEEQSKAPSSVGGIVIGANKWVPKGMTIQKSAIVGGGKETYVETIADSMGKLLTPEQLKKAGLGDAKSVNELKKELEKIAKGQGWKLDVFDTPQGREYRGVLLDSEDDQKTDDKKKEDKKDESEDGKKDESSEEAEEEKGSEETYKDEL